MKNMRQNISREMWLFFSTPVAAHRCILRLFIKLTKLSIKESKKLTFNKN